MRGGALPPGLLLAALGFALAFAPRSVLLSALVAAAMTSIAAVFLTPRAFPLDLAFAGCWVSVAMTAATVHLPRGPVGWLAMLLAINAGLWSGIVIKLAGAPSDLVRALPTVLLALPAMWLAAHRGGIAVKVVASWLIAVALLAGTLPIVSTPGYVPDHME